VLAPEGGGEPGSEAGASAARRRTGHAVVRQFRPGAERQRSKKNKIRPAFWAKKNVKKKTLQKIYGRKKSKKS